MKVFIYCIKAKPYLWWQLYYTDRHEEICQSNLTLKQIGITEDDVLNGKIVASFDLNKIDTLKKIKYANEYYKPDRNYPETPYTIILDLVGMSNTELFEYGKGKDLYAWHIENLEIIEPLELGEFYTFRKGYENQLHMNKKTITKAPQNYRYAYYKGERCIILSVKAKWVEKILNGEKTIEVRKTAPKEMLKNE